MMLPSSVAAPAQLLTSPNTVSPLSDRIIAGSAVSYIDATKLIAERNRIIQRIPRSALR